jgi:hypothetical protein
MVQRTMCLGERAVCAPLCERKKLLCQQLFRKKSFAFSKLVSYSTFKSKVMENACYIITLIIVAVIVIIGLMDILRKRNASEDNLEAIQRQIRGFGLLILSSLVLIVGTSICLGIDFGRGRFNAATFGY